MTFGERLKAARKEQKLTQKALADRLSISQAAVYQFERLENPPKYETLRRIAGALNVSIFSLMGDLSPETASQLSTTIIDAVATQKGIDPKDENILNKIDDVFLLGHFHKLNDDGKEKVIDYAADLAENPKYQNLTGSPKE